MVVVRVHLCQGEVRGQDVFKVESPKVLIANCWSGYLVSVYKYIDKASLQILICPV